MSNRIHYPPNLRLYAKRYDTGGRYRRRNASLERSRALFIANLRKRNYTENAAIRKFNAEEKRNRTITNLNRLQKYSGFEGLKWYKRGRQNLKRINRRRRGLKQATMEMQGLLRGITRNKPTVEAPPVVLTPNIRSQIDELNRKINETVAENEILQQRNQEYMKNLQNPGTYADMSGIEGVEGTGEGGRYRRRGYTVAQSRNAFINNLVKRGYWRKTGMSMWNKEERRKRMIRNLRTLNKVSGYRNIKGYKRLRASWNKNSWRAFLKANPYNRSVHGLYSNYLKLMSRIRKGAQPTMTPTMTQPITQTLSTLLPPVLDRELPAADSLEGTLRRKQIILERKEREKIARMQDYVNQYKNEIKQRTMAATSPYDIETINRMRKFVEDYEHQINARKNNLQLVLAQQPSIKQNIFDLVEGVNIPRPIKAESLYTKYRLEAKLRGVNKKEFDRNIWPKIRNELIRGPVIFETVQQKNKLPLSLFDQIVSQSPLAISNF